jgi:hypothetical protein
MVGEFAAQAKTFSAFRAFSAIFYRVVAGT